MAKAMEVLDERWTMLVIGELLCGSRHFNALRRGVPRMSPTLLSARLRTLLRAGLIERYQDGNQVSYVLTPAGEQLRPIVEALGQWGLRWMPELGDEDLDPHLLMWDIRRNVDVRALPRERTVLQFVFADLPAALKSWWLVMTRDEVDVCNADPGYSVTAMVHTDLRTLTRIWRGELSWANWQKSAMLQIHGSVGARRNVPRWLSKTTILPVQLA